MSHDTLLSNLSDLITVDETTEKNGGGGNGGESTTTIKTMDLEDIQCKATVQAASINSNNRIRDWRMRREFLEVEKYPEMSFRSTGVKKLPLSGAGEGGERPFSSYLLKGIACIRGVEKEIELKVQIDAAGSAKKTADAGGKCGASEANDNNNQNQIKCSVTGEINRFDFDCMPSWGKWAVGEIIYLNFDIQAIVAKKEGATNPCETS